MLSPTIRRLSALTVNRIAAGEVIERPAAAVKELVENALDAGARRVEVILAGGGIARTEVIDDGCGIPEDQLALAIERHATSKLADETLVQIATLGFRGEALPSIGAAARLTLISRPAGQDSAYRLSVVGGAVSPVMPAAGPVGTRAIVEDLFFATPARRKFLRSPRAEAEAAERAVWRLALAAPQVAFRLVSEERVLFDVPAQDEAARVASLFGRDAAGMMLELEATREGVRLTGLAGPASLSRATTQLQSFVVNGRPVLDPVLRMALRLAYRDVIAAGRHPVAALRLEIPAEALDVNVHPAKTELRFADANGVRSLVMGAIARLLERPVSLAMAPMAPLAPRRRHQRCHAQLHAGPGAAAAFLCAGRHGRAGLRRGGAGAGRTPCGPADRGRGAGPGASFGRPGGADFRHLSAGGGGGRVAGAGGPARRA